MKPYRLTGALAITAGASLAVFAGSASATQVAISGACEFRDGRQALVVTYDAQGWPLGSRLEETAARDGAVFDATTFPTSAELLEGWSLPESREAVAYLPGPAASVRATGSIAAYLPGEAEVYRSAVLDTVLPCPGAVTTPGGPAAVEPLPRLISVPHVRKPTKPQRPRLTCATIPKGAGLRWYAKLGCAIPARFRNVGPFRAVAVTGEYRAQGPNPASIVSGLLSQVPQLAQDVPNASSIQQGAGGRSASGGVSGAERGRLVPLPIPGHPWTSRSTAPHRGVAVSVTWRSGRLTVSVLYSASRGRSTTSVSAR